MLCKNVTVSYQKLYHRFLKIRKVKNLRQLHYLQWIERIDFFSSLNHKWWVILRFLWFCWKGYYIVNVFIKMFDLTNFRRPFFRDDINITFISLQLMTWFQTIWYILQNLSNKTNTFIKRNSTFGTDNTNTIQSLCVLYFTRCKTSKLSQVIANVMFWHILTTRFFLEKSSSSERNH